MKNIIGDNFNIEAVCPYYLPESQCTFTWYRGYGMVIVSGYDPEFDEDVHWLCHCGNYATWGGHCDKCGQDAPWGCDCGICNDRRAESIEQGYWNDYQS